ncbi:PREDICTED: uncharacterized protein LOC107880313 [Prunus mume]|uniref:Uncharacterized protein LOC107880313 n=1 Tax=Prunus mume TaxID=102107 RepID=A0ABM1LI46_PRUMU|nr:PREDICTED: uncharacterized protein LOC107880313 [Prunus mume]
MEEILGNMVPDYRPTFHCFQNGEKVFEVDLYELRIAFEQLYSYVVPVGTTQPTGSSGMEERRAEQLVIQAKKEENDKEVAGGFKLGSGRALSQRKGAATLSQQRGGLVEAVESSTAPSLHDVMQAGTGQLKFAVVAVDYFTKWTEPEALSTITAAKIEHFVWRNILCRFGLPNAIVTDNGKQFDCSRFWHLCSRFNISILFASPAHPQSNRQVEAINKIIKKTLKKKLGAAKGNWPAILPEALWAINTSYRRSTGETPFSLAFGTEAVVQVEVHAPTCRTASYDPQQNEHQLAHNLDLIDEHRWQAQLRNATYKQRTARYYDLRVKHRSFKVGDWVLRKVSLATRNPTEGTLGPFWEGPYEIVSICRPGTFRLRGSDGRTLGHPWNVEHLKFYYK